MIYRVCQTIALIGALLGAALGHRLGVSEDGVPRVIPVLGGICLAVVAEMFWRRAPRCRQALARLYRALATCYAVGAACGGQVAILVALRLAGIEFPHLVQWLLLVAMPWAAWMLASLAWRSPTVRMRASSAAAWISLLIVAVAIGLGPPDSRLTAAVIVGVAWGALVAAPVAMLCWLPRRTVLG